jgi:protein KTI12
MRFEEPSSMVRWDSPLISIPWDEDPPYEEIWNVVMKGAKKGPTAATLQVSAFMLPRPLDLGIRVKLMSAVKTTSKRPTHSHQYNINDNILSPHPPSNSPNSIHIPNPFATSIIRSDPTSPNASCDFARDAEIEKTV